MFVLLQRAVRCLDLFCLRPGRIGTCMCMVNTVGSGIGPDVCQPLPQYDTDNGGLGTSWDDVILSRLQGCYILPQTHWICNCATSISFVRKRI